MADNFFSIINFVNKQLKKCRKTVEFLSKIRFAFFNIRLSNVLSSISTLRKNLYFFWNIKNISTITFQKESMHLKFCPPNNHALDWNYFKSCTWHFQVLCQSADLDTLLKVFSWNHRKSTPILHKFPWIFVKSIVKV